ncbi:MULTISPECIES: ABC transporter substrate-binding protein [Devosia]|jgi:branched-chain amino acid transport system substrate-binding protein|uniref:ABC transporter substrate-binding protein n=1 Tax=Devosia litorisediminis TaxID=2829817 RepID=A0A942ECJ0_9HYPH|nr:MULTISPECIES: ABC transporter substrate-binding protein [Devosia]MBS3849732.1 ABC transporter substrate-binding protein [Devosia litorisediminis]MCZ4346775.1 ABC transporter substrate-binding protein [Devosia neptuniae]|tara:strand:+ start:7274 stop:8470 length:1197 start_codon:yes stop_codon:yes gene_type:complete
MKLQTLILASAASLLMAGTAMATDIKIGVLNDRSGVYADLSGEGSVIAARMAVEDFDAAAKGINVEIVSADHQNKPDVASTIARQWYDQDGVDMIADVPTSSAAFAVAEVTRDKNKIFMDSGAGSADLTGAQCSPNTVHWTYDTWALAHGTGTAMVQEGYKKWFFITADYAFGQALEKDTSAVVEAAGGEVLGAVRHPFPGTDFSSYLLQAQASGAQVIGLANAGGDTVNTIKQAAEFGITQAGQALAGLLIFITDVHALGLETAQGLVLTEAFYWDLNDDTRAWSERFAAQNGGNMPTMVHAGVYASVLHYLKAVEATGGKDTAALMDEMKAEPSQDPLFGQGMVRPDGRHIHDMYLFQVKSPDESTGPWDYYNLLAAIPAKDAFRPLADGGCDLVK